MSWQSDVEPLDAEDHAHRASACARYGDNERAMAHALASIALSLLDLTRPGDE